MKKLLTYLAISLLSFDSFAQSVEEHYAAAYDELKAMLEGSKPYSFKRAVFLTENAYLRDSLDYEQFSQAINFYAQFTHRMLQHRELLYQGEDKTEVAKNAALFSLMTDTIPILNDGDTLYHLPFGYDFEDFWGEQHWPKMFVSKLIATHTGNCHSLPYFYKILAEETGAKAYLSLAPNHVYIKTRNQKDGWYNTELTSGMFPVDAWMMASGYIHLSAIQNGIYMDTLSQEQNIALCLIDLAHGYEKKYQDTKFVMQCVDLALQYYPHYANGLLLKAETIKKQFEQMMTKYKATYPVDLFELIPESKMLFDKMQATYLQVHQLGYRTMPKEMYLAWLSDLQKEKEKYTNQNIRY